MHMVTDLFHCIIFFFCLYFEFMAYCAFSSNYASAFDGMAMKYEEDLFLFFFF